MPSTGKEIFENLVEYPLPEKAGVKDYIFYFVPLDYGYGLGAKRFFDKHYTKHVRKKAQSLEELISILELEVKSLSQIREIVIVCHGNTETLTLPLINDIDTSKNNPKNKEYWFLSAGSLQRLQNDFFKGKHKEFSEKRKKVVAKLLENSWITIRACRFGQSVEGLYAFYAFFGGKANVYAPELWQFFGDTPIGDGWRYSSIDSYFDHLLKQRFLPRKERTPEQKKKIINHFTENNKFQEPFELASQTIQNPPTTEMSKYQKIIKELNDNQVVLSSELKEKLKLLKIGKLKKSIPLKAKNEEDSEWLIYFDYIDKNETIYKVQFLISA